ncbi:LOW QUALITY PROTEIN: hypothetical protein U9M48_030524 [Paspalum notatum var. saurae]|uniref:Uncharacterized protein n=1 Tax=Paspalum notatum var. saurae TaxID=547442 RepID=A0AAQ3X3C1_PASNO
MALGESNFGIMRQCWVSVVDKLEAWCKMLWRMLKLRRAWRGFVWLRSGPDNQPLLSLTASLWCSP